MQNTAQANTEIETSLESISTARQKTNIGSRPLKASRASKKEAKDSRNDRVAKLCFAESKKLPKAAPIGGQAYLAVTG